MAYIEWDDTLETGVDSIDEQHRYLFSLMNDVYESAHSDDPAADLVEDVMYRLADYVTQHFEDEQILMAEAGFPNLGIHRGMHERLTAETMQMMARFINGEDVSPVALVDFLGGWLRNHILEEDRRIAAFVHGRGKST